MANLKQLSLKPERLIGGHRLCPGCGASVAVRQVLMASEEPVIVTCATGCLEVATTIFPYTSWDIPFFHSAFENSAATCTGIEASYEILKKKGRLPKDTKINFVAFGGDGGTYDIGLQSLSGALERGHRFVYVCYDNEAYENTGIQRSSATPKGASTTTKPAGKLSYGKDKLKKDLTEICVSHNIPYAAQCSISHWNDTIEKAKKAFAAEGPAFLNILASCNRGWRVRPEQSIEICKLAVDTYFWPLYEVVNGEYKITYKPREKKPVEEYLKMQGRFSHLFTNKENAHVVEEIQGDVDKRWERLIAKEEASKKEKLA